MARAPVNVLIFPFRRIGAGGYEYAVFRRADEAGEVWQGVAGGVEDNETTLEAARRELCEETRLMPMAGWIALDSRASVPASIFRDGAHWGPEVYVVAEHAFGVEVTGEDQIRLSDEHCEVRWAPLGAASALVRYDSNRTALWELNARLTGVR
jgi:dATP pyrophosphohydrolase